MAMEIYVLSDHRLNSLAEWQRAINAEHFPFPLQLLANNSIADLGGFLPAHYERMKAGFECDYWDPRSIMADHPQIEFGHSWKYALAFRFGARKGELESAWIAATSYARATRGVVFDTEEGKIFKPDEAVRLVRKIESNRSLRATVDERIRQKFSPQN